MSLLNRGIGALAQALDLCSRVGPAADFGAVFPARAGLLGEQHPPGDAEHLAIDVAGLLACEEHIGRRQF
jgi:hypothetical protein